MVIAALGRVYGGVRGVYPGSSTAGAQRQPGDDAGLQTFHSGKTFVCVCVVLPFITDISVIMKSKVQTTIDCILFHYSI